MSLGFTRFWGMLMLDSDLHVGSGNNDDNLATLVRDASDQIVIPGSTLKGAIRARLDKKTAEGLFGTAKDDGTGSASRIVFYAAVLDRKNVDAGCLPPHEGGSAIATHVAIDRAHGGAEHQKLFRREIVPAGAKFHFDAVALGAPERAIEDIRTAMAPLVDGLALGHGVGKGNGRLRLDGVHVTTTRRWLDTSCTPPKIENEEKDLRLNTSAGEWAQKCVRFSFLCAGPYLSHDPDAPESAGNRNIQFSLRRNESTPVLWPESLYGVLRRRCAWIARTDSIRDCDERLRVLRDREDPTTLTRTERLFGVTGWRGLVRLGEVTLCGGKRRSEHGDGMAGIALDRFSGAVLDGKLFFSDAWTGLTLTFTLGLDPDRPVQKEDKALFDELVAEIRAEGLQLGHGTNRGFGWFDPV